MQGLGFGFLILQFLFVDWSFLNEGTVIDSLNFSLFDGKFMRRTSRRKVL